MRKYYIFSSLAQFERRLIQEREYYPLGSDTPRRMHARVVAATHQDPSELRQDLYYRLRAYRVHIPPLRERLGDLPQLVDHFLTLASQDLDKALPEVPEQLLEHLSRFSFPGNVRELQALIFEAMALWDEGPLPLSPVLDAMATEQTLTATGKRRSVRPLELPSQNMHLGGPSKDP